MASLLDALLAYANANSGPARFERVELQEVLRAVEHDLEPRILRVRGKIQQFGPLPAVAGDAALLRQLFQNLLSNALKFHRPDVPPVVTVRAEVGGDPAKRFVTVSVVDNGIGFANEHAERIFQPFDRLHSKSEFEGTGLGLAICQRVVARHGGSIRAHGEPGRGATFIFMLPLASSPENSGNPPSVSRAPARARPDAAARP